MQTSNSVDINVLSTIKPIKKNILTTSDGYVKIWDLVSDIKYHYSGSVNADNIFEGYGEIIYYNNKITKSYKGFFINGLKHGFGQEVYSNDDIFCGEYLSDKRNGQGKLYSNNGILKYSGIWLDDRITGKICGYDYDISGKKIYFGSIENGLPDGYGVKLQNDEITQLALYDKGDVIKKIDFDSKIPKFLKSDTDIKLIEKLVDDLSKESNMSNLLKFDKYMISESDNNLTLFLPDGKKYYSGFVYKNKKNEYVLDGEGIAYIKLYNSNEQMRFEGKFVKNQFTNGSIYGIQHIEPIFTGELNPLNMSVTNIASGDIHKYLIKGSYFFNNIKNSFKNKKINLDKCIYEGIFLNGCCSEGIIYSLNKQKIYEGTFLTTAQSLLESLTKFHGFGTENYINSDKPRYQGNFQNGLYNGDGVIFHEENGSIAYCGKFLNGDKHGQGILYDLDGNLIYEGIFTYDNIDQS